MFIQHILLVNTLVHIFIQWFIFKVGVLREIMYELLNFVFSHS